MTFKADGRYEAALATGPAKGTIAITDGRLQFKSATTGRLGTLMLHEGGGGERILVG